MDENNNSKLNNHIYMPSISSYRNENLNDYENIIGVDNHGFSFIWNLQEKKDHEMDDENQLKDFSYIKTILPDQGFYFKDVKRVEKMDNFNDNFMIYCGEFNSFLVDKKELLKVRKSEKSNSIKIEQNNSNLHSFTDYKEANSTINGFDFDQINKKVLFFSDNDTALIYDIETRKKLAKIKNVSFQTKPYISSVLSGKILSKYNKIVLGSAEGYVQFFDYRSHQYIGTYSPYLNEYITNKENALNSQLNQKINDPVSAISNYNDFTLIFGCNSYGFKYNLEFNLVTQLYKNQAQINDIIVDNDRNISFAANTNSVMKFDSTGRLLKNMNVSSSSVFSMKNINVGGKNVTACSGDSNKVDVFSNDIFIKLMF